MQSCCGLLVAVFINLFSPKSKESERQYNLHLTTFMNLKKSGSSPNHKKKHLTFSNQPKTHHNNTHHWPCTFRSKTTGLTFSPSQRIVFRFTIRTGNPFMTSTTTSGHSTRTFRANTLVDRHGSIFVWMIALFDTGSFWNVSITHQTWQSAAQRAKKALTTLTTHLQLIFNVVCFAHTSIKLIGAQ